MQNGFLAKYPRTSVWDTVRAICGCKDGTRKTFFLHIPKCAGTSVWQLLRVIYGSKNVFVVGTSEDRQKFAAMDADKRNSFGAIGGHVDLNFFLANVCDHNHYYKIVTFRHPVERVVSNYWYSHARYEAISRLSLLEFARSPMQINLQTTLMCGEADPIRAMRNLDEYFDDWYMMEDLDRLPNVLCERLGKRIPIFPHENKGRTPDDKAEYAAFAEIERMNEADMVFYSMLRNRRAGATRALHAFEP